nr:MAG TPA: holin [Caudoviricetes sp.]
MFSTRRGAFLLERIMCEIIEMIEGAIVSLLENWYIKSIFAAIGSAAMWLIGLRPVQVMGLFILLVLLDLLTKWAALSYQWLIELGASPERISMLDKWLAIPAAWGKRIIISRHMRKPFCDKVLTYLVATFAAWLADEFTGTPILMKFAWLYLSGAEFLSILENMRDGGNVTMGKFLVLVNDKVKKRVGI